MKIINLIAILLSILIASHATIACQTSYDCPGQYCVFTPKGSLCTGLGNLNTLCSTYPISGGVYFQGPPCGYNLTCKPHPRESCYSSCQV
ncbi:hypothetical protein DICPUDRAFT_154451 [Dictyostelium purpureum]|uniref:Dickkopf N-terminal cysteine-rich domain-containing protein n=1 Tax=Dictyostelium purpureum TaxID=5786 RepID=F0ZRC8_DICPU|nr:uncharacterized protein DICPUDRAFT_154451 [Dictyostelium purpureum]EGC33492.1 hypothetical protein DICPUDRAFT_154451 [Dictyostelium purpureum]|eukprot:XP_003289966.1 hypothetical protein DICPUDRAFT_154451 [Dictyostelium purpureum]